MAAMAGKLEGAVDKIVHDLNLKKRYLNTRLEKGPSTDLYEWLSDILYMTNELSGAERVLGLVISTLPAPQNEAAVVFRS